MSGVFVNVKIKKLRSGVVMPKFMSEEAAGADLCASFEARNSEEYPLILRPGYRALVKCGFSMELPPGYEAQIRPRSGLAFKKGITVLNSPGTIDSDYRGEVAVLLINHGFDPFYIYDGDRIAQMVIAQVPKVQFEEVADLGDTERGEGGFGSTGA